MSFLDGFGILGEIAESLGVGEMVGEALGVGKRDTSAEAPQVTYERRISRRNRPVNPNDI